MDKEIMSLEENSVANHRVSPSYMYAMAPNQNQGNSQSELMNPNRHPRPTSEDQLGPLPSNWEKAYTDTGEVYFIE